MAKGYIPDTRTRLTHATRFFARIERATLECPRCGYVYTITSRSPSANWDPMTARFTCTNKTSGSECGRVYILGVVTWPVHPGGGLATPEDQVPNERQLSMLRREGGGWWLAQEAKQTVKRPQESNLTLEEERPDEDED